MGRPEQEIKHIDGHFQQAGSGNPDEPRLDPGAASPFKFHAFSTHIPEDRITAVLLVPFMPDGTIVAVEHSQRGIDIPGGHREQTDASNYETARRELLEEAGVGMGQMIPCLLMETTGYGGDNEPSYMVVMTGVTQQVGEFKPSKEIIARHFLSPEVFLQSYGGKYEKDMAFIIKTAQRTLNDAHGAAPESFTWNQ